MKACRATLTCTMPRIGFALFACVVAMSLIASSCRSSAPVTPALGLDWQWRNPLPGNSDLNDVAFAQEMFVAVGESGTILVSGDGETWERSEASTSIPLYGIAYGQGIFVAVGGEWAKGYSASLVTTDGHHWTLTKVGEGNQLVGVAYGNDILVAIGNSWAGDLGVIYTSKDGLAWTLRKTGAPSLGHVSFDGDRFLAMGEEGVLLCSADGVNWTQTTSPVEVDSLARGAGGYLGVGGVSIAEPLAFVTPNLQDWTSSRLPPEAGCLKVVVYGRGHFVSAGYNGTVLTSADGLTWAVQSSGIESALNGVAFGNGRVVVVGDEGAIISSPGPPETADSQVWAWTLDVAGTRQFLQGVTYGNGMFVGLGSGGRVVTSHDGIGWTSVPETDALAPWSFTGVQYGNGKFVATAMYYGREPGVFVSEDGVDWEPVSPYPWPPYGTMDRGFSAITFGNGRFVVAQQYGVTMVSVDGLNWRWSQSEPRRRFSDVAWGDGCFVAAAQNGNSGAILTSDDGMTWAENAVQGTASPCAVAYGGGQYVAACLDGAIYSTSDCSQWALRRPADGNELRRIAFGDGMFVAVGNSGTVVTSQGGTAWFENTSHTVRQLEDVMYAQGCFVIVGDAGTIMSAEATQAP